MATKHTILMTHSHESKEYGVEAEIVIHNDDNWNVEIKTIIPLDKVHLPEEELKNYTKTPSEVGLTEDHIYREYEITQETQLQREQVYHSGLSQLDDDNLRLLYDNEDPCEELSSMNTEQLLDITEFPNFTCLQFDELIVLIRELGFDGCDDIVDKLETLREDVGDVRQVAMEYKSLVKYLLDRQFPNWRSNKHAYRLVKQYIGGEGE